MADDAWEPDALPITVPQSLHDAMAKATDKDFAVSYLCGAVVHEGVLHPRTFTAAMRLRNRPDALHVLAQFGLRIGEHIPVEDRMLIPAVERAKAENKRKPKW